MGETRSGSVATLIPLDTEEPCRDCRGDHAPKEVRDWPETRRPAKIDRDLIHKAKLIAADRGVPMAGYLSAILRPAVDRDWAKMIRKAGSEEARRDSERGFYRPLPGYAPDGCQGQFRKYCPALHLRDHGCSRLQWMGLTAQVIGV